MQAIVVIPARLKSARFPEKVLARETGKYLIEHVYEQAKKARLVSDVLVATDSEKVIRACDEFGAKSYITPPELPSGTDRIAYLVEKENIQADVIVNLQGDEADMPPENIDRVIELLTDENVPMGTLATPFRSIEDIENPNNVKVIVDKDGYAIYFSRSVIPYPREGYSSVPEGFKYYHHLGLYAYRRGFLLEITKLPLAPIEKIEKLEQLRALWNGFKIKVGITNLRSEGIDTMEDYAKFVKRFLELSER